MKKDGEGEPSFFILRGAIEGDDRLGCLKNGAAKGWFREKVKKIATPFVIRLRPVPQRAAWAFLNHKLKGQTRMLCSVQPGTAGGRI